MTNHMPIRRLDLLSRRVEQQALVMAWVDRPSLAVIASDQYCANATDHRVRYVSGTRHVDVELTVDEVGMVIHYPDLAVLAAVAADA